MIYPTPKVNPRATLFTSTDELRGMKAELEDECRGIMQVAFITEPEEGASSRVAIPGEDIPDDSARPRDERRRSNLSVTTTNTCPTDRPTVNFDDRKHHRTSIINQVQQNLMNISNNNDRVSNVNVRPDRPDNPNPWSRNTDHNRDNHLYLLPFQPLSHQLWFSSASPLCVIVHSNLRGLPIHSCQRGSSDLTSHWLKI